MNLVLSILGIIALGAFMFWYLERCPHSWKVIKAHDIMRTRDNKKVGYHRVLECEHCKKLKSQEINLN